MANPCDARPSVQNGRCSGFGALLLAACASIAPAREAAADFFTNYAQWQAAVALPVTTIGFEEPPLDVLEISNWYEEGWGVRFQGATPIDTPVPVERWCFVEGCPNIFLWVQPIASVSRTVLYVHFDTPIIGVAATAGDEAQLKGFAADGTQIGPVQTIGWGMNQPWGVTYSQPVSTLRFESWHGESFYLGDLHWAHVPAPGAFAVLLPMLFPALRGSRRRGSA